MANELSTVLITKWKKETKLAFQQKTAKFEPLIDVVRDVGAETYKFPKLAAVTAVAGPNLGSDHSGIASVHTEATATLVDRYAPLYLKEMEMKRAAEGDGLRNSYQRNSRKAINRWVDGIVVTAMDASSTALTENDATDGFTLDKFLEGMEKLGDSEADDGEISMIIGPQQVRDMLQISQFTNADYQALHIINAGKIASIFGVTVVRSNLLTVAASPLIRDCYLFHKMAVGLAYVAEPQTKLAWLEAKDQFLISTKVCAGSVVVEATGIVQLQCIEAA